MRVTEMFSPIRVPSWVTISPTDPSKTWDDVLGLALVLGLHRSYTTLLLETLFGDVLGS
jgi:hypothetical protein